VLIFKDSELPVKPLKIIASTRHSLIKSMNSCAHKDAHGLNKKYAGDYSLFEKSVEDFIYH